MADGARRAPDWAWEEIVLVCDLVAQNQWQQVTVHSPETIELSELLQTMDIFPAEVRGDKFRNPNGVVRKSADIATSHPGYRGAKTNGGLRTQGVVAEFIRNPVAMHALAVLLHSSLAAGEALELPQDVGYENESEMEGRYLLRLHAYRERNPALRRKKISSVLAADGSLACEVCAFDFAQQYGERGQGYIECHHVEPLHVGGEKARSVKDLALLCSNCHRMIHTKPPWPTPAELRDLIRGQPNGHQA
jgi:5-methylcytosine-specific restriction protein A